MSTAYSGVDGTVTIGAVDMDVRKHEFTVKDDGFDSTTTADAGWSHMTDSIRMVEGSMEFFFNTSKNPFATPMTLFARPSVYPTLTLNIGGGKSASGPAKIKELKITSEVKDGILMSCNFTSRGAWTLPTS
jgi:hypothetical protein